MELHREPNYFWKQNTKWKLIKTRHECCGIVTYGAWGGHYVPLGSSNDVIRGALQEYIPNSELARPE